MDCNFVSPLKPLADSFYLPSKHGNLFSAAAKGGRLGDFLVVSTWLPKYINIRSKERRIRHLGQTQL